MLSRSTRPSQRHPPLLPFVTSQHRTEQYASWPLCVRSVLCGCVAHLQFEVEHGRRVRLVGVLLLLHLAEKVVPELERVLPSRTSNTT